MSEKIKRMSEEDDFLKVNRELNERNIASSAFKIDASMLVPQPQHVVIDESNLNPAKSTFERLVIYIRNFEKELDEEHEIGARLVSFGNANTFHILDINYFGPDIITFYGLDDKEQKVQLIQNISQLNVLLVALKKLEEKPRRLGFNLDQKPFQEKA